LTWHWFSYRHVIIAKLQSVLEIHMCDRYSVDRELQLEAHAYGALSLFEFVACLDMHFE
jgi:hypothetical protein